MKLSIIVSITERLQRGPDFFVAQQRMEVYSLKYNSIRFIYETNIRKENFCSRP
jgi:hypothetical protein